MIFRPELAAKVLDGTKTATRRRLTAYKHRKGSAIRYRVGRVYAVQPGRGQRHVGHIKVTGVREERLFDISVEDVRREGFASLDDFLWYWQQLHGHWRSNDVVAVIDFELADRCPDCHALAGGEPAP